MPVGGSLVILMEDSRMPWGMMWASRVPAGSAEMYTLYASCDSSEYCSIFFSSVDSLLGN